MKRRPGTAAIQTASHLCRAGAVAITTALLALLPIVGAGANPTQGSVSPAEGSTTNWSGAVPTPAPPSNPIAAESFAVANPSPTPFYPINSEAGWTFTVNAPILITQVGVWDGANDSNGAPGDGLIEQHTVRIYDSQGRSLLPPTIVKPVEALDADGFHYLVLSDPLILRPGTYTISATYGNGFDPVGTNGSNTDNTTQVSYLEGAISISNDPDEDPGMPVPDGTSGSYFGPNFKFTPTTPPAAVLTFEGGIPAPPAEQGERGWAFTVNRPVVVTDLGAYDEGGDGLQNRLITIRDAVGNLVVQQFVSGSDPIDSASFRYRKLPTPLNLAPGSYTISTFYSNASDPYVKDATFIGTDTRITYNGAVTDDGSCFFAFQGCVPSQRSTDRGYIGPNFRVTPDALKDQFLLSVEGNRLDYKQQDLRVKIDIQPSEQGEDFDAYVYEAVPDPTPEPGLGDSPPVYKEGPLVAHASHQGGQGETTYFYPSELGAGPYLVDVYYRSGTDSNGPNVYNGTATVELIPTAPAGSPPTYKTAGSGGTITFGPNITVKAPFASSDGNPQNRTDRDGNNYIGAMRGAPAGVDLWYIDLRPIIDDPNNPGQPIANPNFDPNARVPIYRGQPVQSSGVGPSFDGYLALGVAPTASPPPIAFSELLGGAVTTGNSADGGQSLSTNGPLVLPYDQNGNPRAIAPQQWEEFLNESIVYLFYRTYAFDHGDTGEVFVHRSMDGGSTFGGPGNANIAVGRLGPMSVDPITGVLYGSGSTGNVFLGIPGSMSDPPPAPDAYTLYQAATDPNGVGHALFVTKLAADGTLYGVYSNGHDIFLISSSDSGQTWSAPIQVNSDKTQTNIFPWLETGPTGKVGVVWYATANSAGLAPNPAARQPNDNSANWKVYFAQVTGANALAPVIEIAEVTEPGHFVHAGNIFDGGYDPAGPEFDFSTMLTNHCLFDYIQISFDPSGAAVVSYTDDHNDFRGNVYVARQITGPGINGVNLPSLVQGKAPEGSGLTAPMPTPGDPTFPPPQPDPTTGAQVTDFAFDWNELGNDATDVRAVRYGTTGGAGNLSIFAAMTVTNLNNVIGLLNLSDPTVPAWRMSFSVNPPNAGVSATDAATGQYSFALSDRGDQFYFEARASFFGLIGPLLGLPPFDFVFGVATRNQDGTLSYSDIGPADFGYCNFNSNTIYVQVSAAKLNSVLPPGRPLIAHKTIVAGLRGQSLLEPFTIGIHQGEQPIDSTRGGTEFKVLDSSAQATTVQFSSGSYSASEADKKVILVVTRAGDVSEAATVDFATSDNTATAPADYAGTQGTLAFGPGQTTQQISVDLVDDTTDEPTETFAVTLSNPQGGAFGTVLGSPSQAVVTILDNDAAPGPGSTSAPAVFRIDQAQDNVGEGDGFAIVTVSRSGDTSGTATVDFGTTDDTANAGSDYTASTGTLVFGPGQTTKVIKVTIIDDTAHESAEDFSIALSNPTGGSAGASLGSPSQAFIIIADNDAVLAPTPTATPSATPTATPSSTPASVELQNISARAFVQTGDKVAIAGFIIHGNVSKHIVVRGLGPSLNVSGALTDPFLELHESNGVTLAVNDNWRQSSNPQQIEMAGLAPSDDREAAINVTLAPGSYTAVLRGVDNGTGVGLIEFFDLDTISTSRIANLSSRTFVSTGDNVLIDGLITRGGKSQKILFRAIGPDLETERGVVGALADPMLELHDQDGALIVANDDWRSSQEAEITATGLAPHDDRDAAILRVVSAGNYTAIVRGKNNSSGIAVGEIYNLGEP